MLTHNLFSVSFFIYSASERLLEMLGTVVAYVDDVLVGSLKYLYMHDSFLKCKIYFGHKSSRF